RQWRNRLEGRPKLVESPPEMVRPPHNESSSSLSSSRSFRRACYHLVSAPPPLRLNAQDQLPGRRQGLQTTESRNAGPVNYIRSLAKKYLLYPFLPLPTSYCGRSVGPPCRPDRSSSSASCMLSIRRSTSV